MSEAKVVKVENIVGHLYVPAAPTTIGMLLLPTVANVNAYMHECGAKLAEAGILALIWDLYDGEKDMSGLDLRGMTAHSRGLTDVATLKDQSRLLDYMLGDLGLQHVGTIGWCLGGRMVFNLAALDHRIECCIAWHPTIYSDIPDSNRLGGTKRSDLHNQTEDEMKRAAEIPCPVQLVRPGNDFMSDERYEVLQAALLSRQAPTQIELYPEAEHGFPYHVEKAANKRANDIAWPSTVSFIRACLTPS